MIYRGDGTATVVGLERVSGRLGTQSGTFGLQRTGGFEGRQARETYTVVAGRGRGQLGGLRGGAPSAVGQGSEHPCRLTYGPARGAPPPLGQTHAWGGGGRAHRGRRGAPDR